MTSREDLLAGEVGARIEGCPDADRLRRFAKGELPDEERQEITRHVEGCDACTEAVAWLRGGAASEEGDLAHELPPEVEGRTERVLGALSGRAPLRSKSPVRAWGWLAAAAVLALVAVGLWQFGDPRTPEEPVLRAADNGTIRSLVPADTPLPRDAVLLRWSASGEVSHYDLQVSTDALDPIAEVKGLTEPEYLVDVTLLENLESGAKLIWQVETVRPGGVRVRSDTFVTVVE